MKAAIIDTSCANLHSIRAALGRIGLEPVLVERPSDVARAELVVLPGVGSFGTAVERLRAQGLVDALRDRLDSGTATLAICAGLQVLARDSEESPGTKGLGLLGASVGRFGHPARVPHMGWNEVRCGWLRNGYGYFANSYRIAADSIDALEATGWEIATADHGGDFVAALRRGRVLACQFHPELSGDWGLQILRDWARTSTGGRTC